MDTELPNTALANIPVTPGTPKRTAFASFNPNTGLFSTPRHHKEPGSGRRVDASSNKSKPWPRIGKRVSKEVVFAAIKSIFGYEPCPWQWEVAEKILEGYDGISLAGTGAGKSLVFAIVAVAARLAGFEGIVLVISPLKALEKDQIRRFNTTRSVMLAGQGSEFTLSTVAVNEDNRDPKVFTELEKGRHHLCYASPEILLRNSSFKKLFRSEAFRRRMIASVVDETHVIEDWKDDFRKDYGELDTLRIIMGSEIPWLGLTATASTRTFEIVYTSLGMGGRRPFYGVDLGSDRPNISQWVRPMAYSMASLHDLLAFVPIGAKDPSAFRKAIFYLKTRQQCRQACDLIRSVVGTGFSDLMYPFTGTNSEGFQEHVLNLLRDGLKTRWIFATIAAGMGADIPDIELVVIVGVCPLKEAFQKGGRGGRASGVEATMIWLVEPWAIRDEEKEKLLTPKQRSALQEKRNNTDLASLNYINCSQSDRCMRRFGVDHFRPKPNLRGFPGYIQPEVEDDGEQECDKVNVTWVVKEQNVDCGKDRCSAAVCREDPRKPVGILSDSDRQVIAHYLRMLGVKTINSESEHEENDGGSGGRKPSTPTLRCSTPEREMLRDALRSWRDTSWAHIKPANPFLSRDWVLTDSNIDRIVDKAHLVLNATEINTEFVASIVTTTLGPSGPLMASLIQVLTEFRDDRKRRDAQALAEKKSKKRVQSSTSAQENNDPFIERAGSSMEANQWKIPGYIHEMSIPVQNPHPWPNPQSSDHWDPRRLVQALPAPPSLHQMASAQPSGQKENLLGATRLL